MGYAIRKDGSGVRAVNGPEDIAGDEYYSESPALPETPVSAAMVAERRYRAETAGVSVRGLRIDTDDRSKLLINGAALEALIDPAYSMQWKCQGEFVQLDAGQILEVARAVRGHVQACFDREAELLAKLNEGTLSTSEVERGWPA